MKRRLQLLPITIFTCLFFVLNWYVVGGLQEVVPYSGFSYLFWSVVTVLAISVLYALVGIKRRGIDRFFKVAMHAFLVVFVSELLFAIVLLVGDGYRLAAGLGNLIFYTGFKLPTRNPYWIEFGIGLFIISVLLFVYGIRKGKYAYRVIRHELYFDDLPDAFDGFTITQISDVHAGSFTNVAEVQKGINLINAQKSDLFVFTGDLVNNKAEEIEPWKGHFSQIKAPFGKYAVLGNHDYGDYVAWPDEQAKNRNLAALKQHHAEIGFRLLLDEHVVLERAGQQLVLAGVENWGLGFGERGDLKRALQFTTPNDFKILLSHDPSHWEEQVKHFPSKIQLTLAGHTHGMQFGIEAFGIKWSPVKWRYRHWAGIKEEFGRVLNVNRGFGFIGFSGRIGIWPEITVITLKKK